MRCEIRNIIIAAVLLVLPLSCRINKDYDLHKSIETEVVLAKNLTVPIGDAGSIKTETMALLFGYEAVTIDEHGNIVLDFSKSSEIVFQFDIGPLGIDISQDIAHPFGFVLGMEVANTSPLSYGVSVCLLDSLGYEVPTYLPIVSNHIEAGSKDDPAISLLEVNVVANRLAPFDRIRFTLTVSAANLSSTEYLLDKGDRLTFNSLRITFPEGIPLSMSWIKEISPYVRLLGFFKKL